MGSAAQFSATLTDWSEGFQDGFTEFKTGDDGKDDFDFPPFSVDPKSETAATNNNATTQSTNQDTPADADPFGDSFAEPSSSVVASSSSSNDGLESFATIEVCEKSESKEADLKPVVIAETSAPASVNEQPTTATAETTSTGVEAKGVESGPSAPKAVELETVPLVDPEALKLQATEPVDVSGLSKDEAAVAKVPSSPTKTTSAEAKVEVKKAEEIDSDKDKKDE
ncbi:hypothetical protein EDD21DRAFT_382177 [Dissophora ornata]|nr:hypothetical protein EDD21DRAFT_382177 [Dissophora ornata]